MAGLFEKIFKPFIYPYIEGDLRIYKKARVLAPVSLTIGIFSIALAVIMLTTGAITVAIAIGFLFAICLATLILMTKKQYGIASSLFVYGLFLVMFAAIKFDAYQNIYECYVFATLGFFVLVVLALIGISQVQVIVMAILTLAAIAFLYISDALPLEEGIVTTLAIQSLSTCAILIIAGSSFVAATIRMQKKLVDETAEMSEASRLQYLETINAINDTQTKSQMISEQLTHSAENLQRAAHQLQNFIEEALQGLAMLDDTISANNRSEHDVLATQKRVTQAINQYFSKIHESSASINQMIQAIEEIGTAALQRQHGVANLSALAHDGEERVAEISHSIQELVQSTSRMEEMNTLIGDVAGRTNLLGMNASIEAAHAGDAGKGFGVVAEEIRALAEEASEGSRTIASILSDTQEMMEQAEKSGQATTEFFSKMSEEIQQVAATLNQLLSRLKEITSGTAEISEAINDFSVFSDEAHHALDEIQTAIEQTVARSSQSQAIAENLRNSSQSIAHACSNLLTEADQLKKLSLENQQYITELKERLA
ncbi:MAG TPA: methyl-accepting chemotaxis protein [Spirochaetales bacterium]|nr:methyl-accepting chemotaxis protein [Spirochaetales bacterium]HRV28556.1 methyl-accepting chemotaxis protein [Spirochaetia bacterium]